MGSLGLPHLPEEVLNWPPPRARSLVLPCLRLVPIAWRRSLVPLRPAKKAAPSRRRRRLPKTGTPLPLSIVDEATSRTLATLTRVGTKQAAAKIASDSVTKTQGEGWGFVTSLGLSLLASATEGADRRHWSLQPDHTVVGLMDLPAGEHSISAGESVIGTARIQSGSSAFCGCRRSSISCHLRWRSAQSPRTETRQPSPMSACRAALAALRCG